MYATFAKEAREEGFNDIALLFENVAKIEKDHEERYRKLFANIKDGVVFEKDNVTRRSLQDSGSDEGRS